MGKRKRPVEEMLGAEPPKPEEPKPVNIPSVAREFLYDAERGQYYRKTAAGNYVKTSETDLKRHLQRSGFFAKGDGGNGLTAFEDELCRAQEERGVDHVVNLAGHAPGIYRTEDGRRILVAQAPGLVAPRPGPITNFQGLLEELFGEQQAHVLSWLKVALEDLHGRDPVRWRHNQLLVLVGEPNCGKSFFQLLLTKLFGGRESDPYLWMIGRSNFNEDLAEAEHLAMGDKTAFRDVKSRAAFGSVIKELAVDSRLAVHGKGKKAIRLPTFRRMSISVNLDSDYITILPIMERSVADKIMLLRCGKAVMLPDYSENIRRFQEELPAFVHFLLHVYQVPADCVHDRYGVATYHSPEVLALLEQFDPLNRFRELLELVLRPEQDDGNPVWFRGSATELQRQLAESQHAHLARQLLTYSSACGQFLRGLADRCPEWIRFSDSKGYRTWTVSALA